jgi:hypothetical protein
VERAERGTGITCGVFFLFREESMTKRGRSQSTFVPDEILQSVFHHITQIIKNTRDVQERCFQQALSFVRQMPDGHTENSASIQEFQV